MKKDTIHEIDEVLEYFSDFYASSIPKDKKGKERCIVNQSNPKKILFDIYIMIALLFTTVVVPLRLAFSEETEPIEWILIYAVIDISFLFDIIATFFTTYTDPITNMEVTSHKKIAMRYIKGGWLIFDILSIIPLD